MCKFVCPEHGEFEPTAVCYSCPAKAYCSVCGKLVEEDGGGIEVLSEEESRRRRPELWGEKP